MTGADEFNMVLVELDELDVGRAVCDWLHCEECGECLVVRQSVEGGVWDSDTAVCPECGAVHGVEVLAGLDYGSPEVTAYVDADGHHLSPAGLAQLQRELEGRP